MNIIEMARDLHKKKLIAAYHEAGHVVVAMSPSCRCHFDYVELDGELGRVVGFDANIPELSRAKIFLGGPLAENIYLGKNISMQFSSIDDMLQLKNVDLTFLKPTVENILRKNWSEVQVLASRLVKEGRIYYSQIFQDESI